VNQITLDHLKLAIGGIDDCSDVFFEVDAADLLGYVVDRDVAGRATLWCGDEVRRSLMSYAHQGGTDAGFIERIVPARIGGCVGYFAHACLNVNEHDGIARGGLAGGLIVDRSGDLNCLCECA